MQWIVPGAVNIIKSQNYPNVMPERPEQQARRAIDSALATAEVVENLHAALDEFALIAGYLRAK
jgi:hypothetical protein